MINRSTSNFSALLVGSQVNAAVVPGGGTIAFDDRYGCCDHLIEGVVGDVPSE